MSGAGGVSTVSCMPWAETECGLPRTQHLRDGVHAAWWVYSVSTWCASSKIRLQACKARICCHASRCDARAKVQHAAALSKWQGVLQRRQLLYSHHRRLIRKQRETRYLCR